MQEEKNRIERVLGATLSPELIQKVLTFALSVSYKEICSLIYGKCPLFSVLLICLNPRLNLSFLGKLGGSFCY
jgi:hypothetical protein